MISGIVSDLFSFVCGYSSDEFGSSHFEKFNLFHLQSNDFSIDPSGYICIQGACIYKQINGTNTHLIIKANFLKTESQFYLVNYDDKLFIFDQNDLTLDHNILFVDLAEKKQLDAIQLHPIFNNEIIRRESYFPLKEQKLTSELLSFFLQKIRSN